MALSVDWAHICLFISTPLISPCILIRCVALPDGGILLMGGRADDVRFNDLWHSSDSGATWTEITPEAGWHARDRHASVILPDGSVLVTGGWSYEGDDEFIPTPS